MRRAKVILALFSALLAFLWLLPKGMQAQDVNRAALIIRESDQTVRTVCVEFAEAEVSGLDVLQRSGIDFKMDVQSMGAKICSIEQTGCPADDCWCQCKGGGDCVYWSYWHRLNGQWTYAQGGVSVYSVGDGDVEGWSWGPGSVTEAFPPPDISFADVCTTESVEEATATPSPTSEPILFVPEDTPTIAATQVQAAYAATVTPLPSATFAATATAAPTITPLAANTATAVPITTETANAALIVFEPTAVPTMTAEAAVHALGHSLNQPAASEPISALSTQSPTPEVAQPASEPYAATMVAAAPTRPFQRENKNLVETAAELDRELPVVGAAFQVADPGPPRIDAAINIAEMESRSGSTSLLSYAIFVLIVLGLGGLLLYSSIRRRKSYG